MIWGVGTGRCGTGSLAHELGAQHEIRDWDGRRETVEPYLLAHRQVNHPVVDYRLSVCVPDILKADPDAEFIWLIREPVACIESLWYRSDMYIENDHLNRPWPGGITRLGGLMGWYEHCYAVLQRETPRDRRTIRRTEDLPEHYQNAHPAHRHAELYAEHFTEERRSIIAARLNPLYRKVLRQ